ncbi:tripartite motif-containing protein 60-like [Choloepus didactylus]|uniref:tripartite motif-containing protein 60-like n=1 Tax=Choloepus didactylus TaxID=27675 RepID=UPI00189E8573|nr:tripartite motif-containing protein 60-like [Choloepus didactylus]
MAFTASFTDLQAEASCPLCWDFLRDPVTIDCGHNFCGSCITQCWEDLQDILPCPICLHHCLDRNLKKNRQLCHMTDIVKQLPTNWNKRKWQEEKPLCEKHSQVLTLFCEEDLELLCAQCQVSSDHRDHHLMPLEQAAATHRKKLRSYIEPLKKQVEDAEKGLEIQVSKSSELRVKVENQREELYSEFEQLKRFLGKEQDVIILKLQTEQMYAEKKLRENKVKFLEHIYTLKNLVSEIAEKCVQSELEFLTGIETIHTKHENLNTPAILSYELRKKDICSLEEYFNLHKIINTFKVNLTLDTETAHLRLVISEDKKSVTLGKMNPNLPYSLENFAFLPSVLSSQGFVFGRHYWQVEIRGKGEWDVGVCKASFPRNAITSPSPKDGCWGIRLWSYTCGAMDTIKSRQVGIFLDYELGQVSFYNLDNRCLIYAFSDTFKEKLFPYFSIGSASDLTIHMVTIE